MIFREITCFQVNAWSTDFAAEKHAATHFLVFKLFHLNKQHAEPPGGLGRSPFLLLMPG